MKGFQKGHRYYPSQSGKRPGRKRTPVGEIKESIKRLSDNLPTLLKKLEKLALGESVICPNCGSMVPGLSKPDRDALIYAIDRVLGKPKQVQEVDLLTKIELTGDQCLKLIERAYIVDAEFKALPVPDMKDIEVRELPEADMAKVEQT